MAADVLATQGARASAAMLLTFSNNIQVSAPEGLTKSVNEQICEQSFPLFHNV